MPRRSDLGIPIDEGERRRAQLAMQRVWRDLVRQLVDTCVNNEEDLQQAGFSYAYQEIEDRFAQRLFLAGQMMGAIQHAGPPQPEAPPPQFRVLRVEGALDELDERINAQLEALPGHTVHDLSLASDDDETWHAFLTVSG